MKCTTTVVILICILDFAVNLKAAEHWVCGPVNISEHDKEGRTILFSFDSLLNTVSTGYVSFRKGDKYTYNIEIQENKVVVHHFQTTMAENDQGEYVPWNNVRQHIFDRKRNILYEKNYRVGETRLGNRKQQAEKFLKNPQEPSYEIIWKPCKSVSFLHKFFSDILSVIYK